MMLFIILSRTCIKYILAIYISLIKQFLKVYHLVMQNDICCPIVVVVLNNETCADISIQSSFYIKHLITPIAGIKLKR